jgi:hypothetical protein
MKALITGGLGFVGTQLSIRVFDMCPSACSGMVLCSCVPPYQRVVEIRLFM